MRMKHNINITNQHRKLTQLQAREGQFILNKQMQDMPYGRAISNPQQQSRQLINSSASAHGPAASMITQSSRNVSLQQLQQKKQNSLGASFNRSGLITGSTSNLTVTAQFKNQKTHAY